MSNIPEDYTIEDWVDYWIKAQYLLQYYYDAGIDSDLCRNIDGTFYMDGYRVKTPNAGVYRKLFEQNIYYRMFTKRLNVLLDIDLDSYTITFKTRIGDKPKGFTLPLDTKFVDFSGDTSSIIYDILVELYFTVAERDLEDAYYREIHRE